MTFTFFLDHTAGREFWLSLARRQNVYGPRMMFSRDLYMILCRAGVWQSSSIWCGCCPKDDVSVETDEFVVRIAGPFLVCLQIPPPSSSPHLASLHTPKQMKCHATLKHCQFFSQNGDDIIVTVHCHRASAVHTSQHLVPNPLVPLLSYIFILYS